MTTTTPPQTVRLLARKKGERRWQLVGEYDTREAAWNALVAVPKGHEIWLNDQHRVKGASRE